MPFLLIIVGTALLISSARNTQSALYTLLAGDFTGPNNFIFWAMSILIIGALGYIPKLKPLSAAFITLVVIVLFLKRGNPTTGTGGGFFQQFTTALGTTQAATPSIAAAPGTSQTSSSSATTASGQSLIPSTGLGSPFGSSDPLQDLLSGQPSGTALGQQVTSDNPLPVFNNPVLSSPVSTDSGSSPSYDILNESYI
jgi:hypothetical protein